MSAARRSLSGPVDQDLEQALPELMRKADRIRQLARPDMLERAKSDKLTLLRLERDDLYGTFETSARKMNLPGEQPGQTLFAIASQAARLCAKMAPRRPTLAHVLDALSAVAGDAEDHLDRARFDYAQARHALLEAKITVEATQAAVVYLEASRG